MAESNTRKRKRTSRRVEREVNSQVFEDNADALALLSQVADDSEGYEDLDPAQYVNLDASNECGGFEDLDPVQCVNLVASNDELFPGDKNDPLECDVKSQSRSFSGCPLEDVCQKPIHVSSISIQDVNDSFDKDVNSSHDPTINSGCSDGVDSNRGDENMSEHKQTSNEFEDGGEANSDSSGSDTDYESLEVPCTSDVSVSTTHQEPHETDSFFVNESDFSPEVWRLIRGEEEEKTQEEMFKIKLAQWSLKYKTKRNALDELLHLLRDNGHADLPACAKTLLQTPRSTIDMVKTVAGGQFWYRGILRALMTCLSAEYVLDLENDTVVIDIFVDGLSPHKKAKRHIWPIAGCLKGKKTPFVIALWCGSSKEPTSVDAFFEDFLNESDDLITNGFLYQGRKLKLSIRHYCADAPARAWIKCVKPHNSYDSCERCTAEGEWKFRRITYNPAELATLRTDESFQNQDHKKHHRGVSPLLRIGTRMISQIPLDIMHMGYLGLSRRLFTLLLKKKAGRFKLPDADIEKLDNLCLFLYKFCAQEFASKPRPLSQYKLYKATEFRRLLLYDGFLLLKKQKHKEVFECYLLIACAMRILLDSKLRAEFSDDAQSLLETFVKRSYKVLGASFVVYNVHHLLHLVDECNLHGDPEDFSCFKYENHLGHLKDFLAAPGRSLQQIICRLIEHSLAPVSTAAAPAPKQFYKAHTCGPALDCKGTQYTAAYFDGFSIRVARDKPRDAFVLMSTRDVVVVENIVDSGTGTFIIGRKFLNKSDYFQFPMPSSVLDIYKICGLGPLQKWSTEEIMKKVCYFPLVTDDDFTGFDWRADEGLCIPMLHSEV